MKSAIGLGAGGHAKGLLEQIGRMTEVEVIGLLDPDPARAGERVLGVPILGDDSRLAELVSDGADCFFVGIGGIGDTGPRERAFARAAAAGLTPLRVVHDAAHVASSAELASGCQILAGAVIGADAHLGAGALVNSCALVEHDCVVGAHAHVSVGARLCGGVRVGDGAHVSPGAVVLEGRSVGEGAFVAAGAVVTSDVAPRDRVGGIPARALRAA